LLALASVATCLPAKYADYSGYAAFYVVDVSDTGKGVDSISKTPAKVGMDSGKGVDAYSRTVSWWRSFADYGLCLEVVGKGIAKPVWDYPFVHEYMFKQIARAKPILESVVALDWYSKDVLRHYVDVAVGADRVTRFLAKLLLDVSLVLERFVIVGLIIVELRDWLAGDHAPVKDVTLCKADTNVVVDYSAKDVWKVYADAVLSADYIRLLSAKALADACVGLDFLVKLSDKALKDSGLWVDWYSKDVWKAVLERVANVDWVLLPWMRLVLLLDSLTGEHAPARDVGKIGLESIVVTDWKKIDLVSCLMDAVKGLDGAYRYFPVALYDYLFTRDYIGFGRFWAVKDTARMEELVAKLGYTLMGKDVWRRVYHKVWYDLIEVDDQNVKIVIAQALIDAFKALYDKLKG